MTQSRWLWVLLGLVLYVASVIPVGVGLYVLKNNLGWGFFSRTGGHAFAACLQHEINAERGIVSPTVIP